MHIETLLYFTILLYNVPLIFKMYNDGEMCLIWDIFGDDLVNVQIYLLFHLNTPFYQKRRIEFILYGGMCYYSLPFPRKQSVSVTDCPTLHSDKESPW